MKAPSLRLGSVAILAAGAVALDLVLRWKSVTAAVALADLSRCIQQTGTDIAGTAAGLVPLVKCSESILPRIADQPQARALMEWILNARTDWGGEFRAMSQVLRSISASADPRLILAETLGHGILVGAAVFAAGSFFMESQPVSAEESVTRKPKAEAAENSRPRVLVIDDDAAFARAAGGALRRKGYEVDYAFDPEKAAPLLSKGNYDAIFCDYFLGEEHGTDLCGRCLPPTRMDRAVIMSGTEHEALQGDSQLKQHQHFLKKPCQAKEIVELADRVVHATANA